MRKLRFALFVLGIFAASLSEAAEPLPINERPMYGGIEKNDAMKQADQKMIAEVLRAGETRDSAAKHGIMRGWEAFSKGDVSTAIKRFNQAWLLNPENGDAYHGFALVTARRGGAPAEIEKYFRLAVSKPGVAVPAIVDYARFLNMSSRPQEAEAQARKALAVAPNAANARAQISYSYLNRRDARRACEWARQAKQNGDALEAGYLENACRGAAN
jgi:tetratricopeptide (TPR) repeat protein